MSIRSVMGLGDEPWLSDQADAVEKFGTNLVQGTVSKVKEWAADDPDTWTDDALRLAGGGIKNLQKWSQDDPDTWTDDALRLTGGGIKNTLKVLGAPGWVGNKALGGMAGIIGVDERWGNWTGEIAGDYLFTMGMGKAAKIAKTAGTIRQANRLGVGIDEIGDVMRGSRAFAYDEAGAAIINKTPKQIDALTASEKTHKRVAKIGKQLTDLEIQDQNWRNIEDFLVSKRGKKFGDDDNRQLYSYLLSPNQLGYKPLAFPTPRAGDVTLAGTSLKKGMNLVEFHHLFGLSDADKPLLRHDSTLRSLKAGKVPAILKMAQDEAGVIVGNLDNNVGGFMALREQAFRLQQTDDIYNLLGGRVPKKTINSALGNSALDINYLDPDIVPDLENFKALNAKLEKMGNSKAAKELGDWPGFETVDAKNITSGLERHHKLTGEKPWKGYVREDRFPNIKLAEKGTHPKTGNPLEKEIGTIKVNNWKEYTGRWDTILKHYGIDDVTARQIRDIPKDPGLSIRGNDHEWIHSHIRSFQSNPNNPLGKLEDLMASGKWHNMSPGKAKNHYIKAQQMHVKIASNVSIYRYQKILEIAEKRGISKAAFEALEPELKLEFMKKFIREIAVAGDVTKEMGMKKVLEPIGNRWTQGMSDVFGYTPQLPAHL